MEKYYTYAYLREDRTPYYIGKGSDNRAYSDHKGYIIVPPIDRILILKYFSDENDAFRHETYLISVFGRKDLGTGILWNRTNGGEGVSGAVFTEITRNRMSQSKMGDKNHFYGKKHSSQTKEKISNTKKGTIPHNKGKYLPINEIGYNGIYMRDYRKGIKRIDRNRKYINPEGEEVVIVNLKAYCKKHNLTYQSMLKLHRGLIKYHKGYTKAP
jgi:hypothetical protein